MCADAAGGIAQLALERARGAILRSVATQGVAVLGDPQLAPSRSDLPDLEPFAEAGLMSLSTVTGGVPVASPEGAHDPVLSTNPFAFAIPIRGSAPLVVDFATSAMSYGDLTLAADAGRAVPPGTGVDATGLRTTDPHGDPCGRRTAPLRRAQARRTESMLVEFLASAMTGGDCSSPFRASCWGALVTHRPVRADPRP